MDKKESAKRINVVSIKVVRESSILYDIRKIQATKDAVELAKMSNTFLSDIETGRSSPTIKTLEKIAEALEIDIKQFF